MFRQLFEEAPLFEMKTFVRCTLAVALMLNVGQAQVLELIDYNSITPYGSTIGFNDLSLGTTNPVYQVGADRLVRHAFRRTSLGDRP